ncbi:sensor histidine kinase [Nonomuraea rubra]|uniref:histidine kinase n=1 Tax=Nonomuraea rubra TaxID=46180 RepID=A0A7X0U2F4_9ACTN|nr:histidine kinase [Nonomuraea rubra]MBB6552390.1 two-component system sensor histidine kinase DesK [Nonomuraea rubra]
MALSSLGAARPGELSPVRLVLAFIAVTGLLRVSFYFTVQEFDPLTVACVAVVAALQIPISLPGRRRLSLALLPVQAAVNYLPLLADPESWEVGGSGFVAASALLVVSGPPAWLILGLVAALECAVALAHDRLPYLVYYAIIAPINVGLMLYGISSLAVLLDQVSRERSELAARAGAVERLRLWGRIHDLVVRNVAAVDRLTREAREASSRGDAAAVRAAVGTAVTLAREALGRVRSLPPADETIEVPPREDDGRLLRLATPILLITHVLFIGQAVFYFVADAERGPGFTHAGYLVLFPLTFALQFWHLAALRSGVRRRTLAWTLTAHALAIYAPLALGEGSGLLASGFFAGVLLLYLPWRVAWPLCVVMSGVAAAEEALSLGPVAALYPFFSVLNTALAVYGLTRLVELVGELSRTRAELVEVAALRERLKVGRDVHDLLGRGLTTIVLHAELALRLLGTDPGQAGGRSGRQRTDADAQLERLAGAARAALSDSVRLNAPGLPLSLEAEIGSAGAVLEQAGVRVRIDAAPVTGTAGPVLAVVLREAVTNVLKHGTPAECTIELAVADGQVRLRVTNDGATASQEVRLRVTNDGASDGQEPAYGSGLRNLRARVAAIGGELATTRTGDRFELLARAPVDHEDLTITR